VVYQRRLIDGVLDELLLGLPALLIDGPKAVGKTTTALQRAATVRRFDVPGELERATADLDWALAGGKPLLLDEWQLLPDIWNAVKRAVDNDSGAGQFLLTGSMPDDSLHSGAGRISNLRMRPLALAERGVIEPSISLGDLLGGNRLGSMRLGHGSLGGHYEPTGETDFGTADYIDEIARSGFPGMRALSGRALKVALDGYIERLVDTDVESVGSEVRRPATLRAWLRSFAAATATTASWEAIRDGANAGSTEPPARSTTLPYRDALERLRIIDDLPPWLPTRNQFARSAATPKHFLADPALAMRLLNLDVESLKSESSEQDARFDRPLLGRMFEALASLSLRVYADSNFARSYHFRDSQGRHEVDFIVEREDGKILPIEIKLGQTLGEPDFKQLRWLAGQLGDQVIDLVVVYSGRYAYRKDGIALIPLAMLTA